MILQENDNNPPLDAHTKSAIRGAAKAAGITALLSVSGTVAGLIVYITKPPATAGLAKEGFDDTAIQTAAKGSAFLISAYTVISLIFVYLLYSFSRLTQQGLKSGDNRTINKGLSCLSSYFKIIGVALLGLLALSFLRMLAMGL